MRGGEQERDVEEVEEVKEVEEEVGGREDQKEQDDAETQRSQSFRREPKEGFLVAPQEHPGRKERAALLGMTPCGPKGRRYRTMELAGHNALRPYREPVHRK